MPSRARHGHLLAAAAALLATGCGSSHLSTPQLRNQATRICQSTSTLTARIATPDLSGGGEFLSRGMAALEPELRRLRALHPAAAAAATYAAATSGLAAEINLLQRARAALDRGGDPVLTMQGLQRRLAPVETRTNRAWHTLEIAACIST